MPDVDAGWLGQRLGHRRSPGTGEDSVGGMDAGDIRVFEVAYVVVTDQVETGSLFALQENVAFKVECRVPVVILDDVPGIEVPPEVGIVRGRAEQG